MDAQNNDALAVRQTDTLWRIWTAAERVQAANSLRASEERYRALFESIDEGFCIIDVIFDDDTPVDYRFVEINPAFATQTGIEDAVGRRMRDIAPSHEAHWFEIYGRVAKTGKSVRFGAEASALGRFYDVKAFRIGAPEQHRVAVVFKDTTERKQLEDQLSESNRRKDEFLATLAHELRNPLAPVTNALALLRLVDDPRRAQELHEIIERQIRHMVHLVDELIDASRITRGRIELRKQPVDLEQVIRAALETSGPHIEVGQRRLSVVTSGELMLVDGDPLRLEQIVANLLNNAAEFTAERGRIWLTLDRVGDRARLSVRDDGEGIPTDMMDEVFEMFVQLRAAGTNGLGVGLTLVRDLVELHGGSIEARSEGVGRGSEFIVHLPLMPCPSEPRI